MACAAENADLEVGEELVLNLVSAITNLSFYNTPTDEPPVPFSGTGVELSSFGVTNIMHMHRLRITRMLAPLLFHDNHEAAVESARAFGNFSRDPEVRCPCVRAWRRACGGGTCGGACASVRDGVAFGVTSLDVCFVSTSVPQVRALMIQLRAVDALVLLLEHTNRELVFTSCGVRQCCDAHSPRRAVTRAPS